MELLLEILLTTDDVLELLDDPGAGAMQEIDRHMRTIHAQVNGVLNGLEAEPERSIGVVCSGKP